MSKRLFVSVGLDGLADEVEAVQERFEGASGLNFTDPEQAHVTLSFLGDTDPDRVDDVTDALAAAVDDAGVEPFTATFGGLGVFPSLDYITVVWLGVTAGGEQLTRLHDAVESHTVELGFEPDDHEFTPHVTLARMDHAGGKARVQQLVRERDPTVGRLTVDEIRLTESVRTDDGPRFTTVAAVPL